MKLSLYAGGLLAALLCACDSAEPPQTPPPQPQMQTADNALIKLQDDTVNKAQNAMNQALDTQSKQLESIGQ